MREPVPHGGQTFGDEVVAAFAAVPLLGHQTGVKQDAEVLGDRRAAHLKVARNRVDGAIGFRQQVEHMPPRGMADGPKDVWRAIGSSDHATNIGKQYLTRQLRDSLSERGLLASLMANRQIYANWGETPSAQSFSVSAKAAERISTGAECALKIPRLG